MKPVISVVTPSLNQGAYLPECLESVHGVGVEHLVIDGGSRDDTTQILASRHQGYWVSEPDNGQTHAINKGLARAQGDILAYLCADDFLEPGALAAVARCFEDTSVDVVHGDGYFLEGNSGWKRRKRTGAFHRDRLLRGNFLIQPAVFWRRRVYERFGPLDERLRYCMDHEYWLRISDTTRWEYLPIPLATSRLHAGAKTSRELGRAWEEARRMQAAYGLRVRPYLEALWMRTLGAHYYLAKRRIFAGLGRWMIVK